MTRGERGFASVLVLGLTMVALGVAGLAIDGTRAFIFRRTLQNAADAAALAGASEIDRTALYASGGRTIVLDPDFARATVREWLARRGLRTEAGMVTEEDAIRVVLVGEVETTFLRVIGVRDIPVRVEAVARPVPGDG